jgi:hypothetical protein
MKKAGTILFLCVLITSRIHSQRPEELLHKWSDKNPVEKVYLHLDREQYAAGETAWFKAYLSSDYLPDTISSSLYVELLNNDLTVVCKAVAPVILGGSSGQLDLPDSITTGLYTVRAFTPAMIKQSPDFIYKKGVTIYGKARKENNNPETSKVRVEFFPEGGTLMPGFNNAVAFKTTTENGLPLSIAGVIKNSKGDVVASFSPYHDGMGMFELTPVPGEKYYATITSPSPESFPLPDLSEKGIVFTVLPHIQGNFFEIQQRVSDPMFTAAYMIGQMQNRVVFKQEFSQAKESLQGVINTKHLHSGIMQVTVFNKNGMPLAERLCFINNKEYLHQAELVADTLNMAPKGRNRFLVTMKDTVQGSISVSISDAAYLPSLTREENILTSLLLTADIKGYVNNPAYYFSKDDDSVKMAIDLLMMTNGWRRFKWTALAAKAPSVIATSSYINLNGRAVLKGTNRPFASKPILLMINSLGNKNVRSTQMLETDKDGNFFIDSLVFFDRNRLLFTDVRGKKSQYIDILLNSDSLQKPFSLKDFVAVPDRKSVFDMAAKWKADYDAILKANGLLLEGVTVKVQKKTPMQLLDENYTNGLFSGDAARAIDLVNSDEASPYNNIFDYLSNRVNGLQIVNEDAGYGVYYRQGASMSSMGNIPVTIFLDEVETDVAVIAALPANQVALVKLYSTFAGASGNGPGGVLAIYTKKGTDYTSGTSFANLSFYNGYSVIKEFYAPDYKVSKATDKPDNRITLDWRPNIFVNSVNPRIPVSFYNNDRTKKFKVVVEGMTTSGKLIWLEKIINP